MRCPSNGRAEGASEGMFVYILIPRTHINPRPSARVMPGGVTEDLTGLPFLVGCVTIEDRSLTSLFFCSFNTFDIKF